MIETPDAFNLLSQDSKSGYAVVQHQNHCVRVRGYDLIRQYHLRQTEYLLVLANEDPWESFHCFNLVSSRFENVEWIEIGCALADGVSSFTPHEEHEELVVSFDRSKTSWKISIANEPTTRHWPKLLKSGSRGLLSKYRMRFDQIEYTQ